MMTWQDAVIVGVAGFTGAALQWALSPRVRNGSDWVAFPAVDCGRAEPRPSVAARLWDALIGPVIRYAARRDDRA